MPLFIFLRHVVDGAAGYVDSQLNFPEDLAAHLRGRLGGELLEQRLLLDQLLLDAPQPVRGRDLAGGVTAHAVGDRIQPELVVDQPAVFIVFAGATNVCQGPRVHSHGAGRTLPVG